MRISRSTVFATAAVAGMLVASETAHAHSMSATVEVRSDGVRVVVYFEDDLPADLATLVVTDAAGAQVATGTTDDHGTCSLPALPPGEYKLTAKCIGHTAAVAFSVAAPAPDNTPTEFAGARPDRVRGLALGAGGLLGASALFWFFRRRP